MPSMSRLLLAALLALAGCHYSLNDTGTEPLTSQFHFPSGIAIDPRQAFLYVSNANADLKYGGGTVQVIDLARFDSALDSFRKCQLAPAGCAANPDAALCKADPVDPMVIDCDATPFVIGDATVKVGNFAGDIRVLDGAPPDQPDNNRRRLFVGVRGDPSITWIDVDLTKRDSPLGMLDCFDAGPGTLAARLRTRPGYDPVAGHNASPPACDGSHLLQTFTLVSNCLDNGANPRVGCPTMTTDLPPEPFGLAMDHGVRADGSVYGRLVVSHLSGGQVTVIDTTQTPPVVSSVSNPFFASDNSSAMRHGAYALAPQHPGQARGLWYMTSNIQPVLATFRIADADVAVPASNISVGGAFAIGSDVREIAFQPDGNRAFFADNNPPSVVVLDTRPSTVNGGLPNNLVSDIVDVCQTPSHLVLQQLLTAGAAGAPALSATRLFVVCFLSNQVMVIDPDRPAVLDTILVGRGPNELAYADASTFPPDARLVAPMKRAYVTNFGEWTLSMIDLDPGSATHDRVVARLGLPIPPQVP